MVVCFIGHRKISVDGSFKERLANLIKELIAEKKFDTFLFGSRSQFDELCLETVSELKNDYPHIKRIYVRAAYPYIDDNYEKYLLSFYDETYIPEKVVKAGSAAYAERNFHMIDKLTSVFSTITKTTNHLLNPLYENSFSHTSLKAEQKSHTNMRL